MNQYLKQLKTTALLLLTCTLNVKATQTPETDISLWSSISQRCSNLITGYKSLPTWQKSAVWTGIGLGTLATIGGIATWTTLRRDAQNPLATLQYLANPQNRNILLRSYRLNRILLLIDLHADDNFRTVLISSGHRHQGVLAGLQQAHPEINRAQIEQKLLDTISQNSTIDEAVVFYMGTANFINSYQLDNSNNAISEPTQLPNLLSALLEKAFFGYVTFTLHARNHTLPFAIQQNQVQALANNPEFQQRLETPYRNWLGWFASLCDRLNDETFKNLLSTLQTDSNFLNLLRLHKVKLLEFFPEHDRVKAICSLEPTEILRLLLIDAGAIPADRQNIDFKNPIDLQTILTAQNQEAQTAEYDRLTQEIEQKLSVSSQNIPQIYRNLITRFKEQNKPEKLAEVARIALGQQHLHPYMFKDYLTGEVRISLCDRFNPQSHVDYSTLLHHVITQFECIHHGDITPLSEMCQTIDFSTFQTLCRTFENKESRLSWLFSSWFLKHEQYIRAYTAVKPNDQYIIELLKIGQSLTFPTLTERCKQIANEHNLLPQEAQQPTCSSHE